MKCEHKVKLELIRLYQQGLRAGGIVKALKAQGHTVTRSIVYYWTNAYLNGKFGDYAEEKTTYFKKVTKRDIDIIRENLNNDPTLSSRDIHKKLISDGAQLGRTTVKRAIKAAGFTNATPRYAQMIRDVNKLKRVEFCQELIANDESFDKVIFSDESTIQLHQNKTTSYRPIGSHGSIPKPKHPLKLHVWAAISRKGPSNITIFEGIMEKEFFTHEILRNNLLPFINRKFNDGHRFQQDNDPKHRSKLAKDFMADNNVNWWTNWPSESPDLNPIEMVWNQLKRYVAKHEPTTKDQLIQCIHEFWRTCMTKEQCNVYIDHMFKVVPVCVVMKGRATADQPNRIFCERSRGKSISYFQNKLQSEEVSKRVDALNLNT